MLDEKMTKKLNKLTIKISNVFTDFYILKQGYLISLDIEKPFIIQLDDEYIKLYEELCGDFNILHIWDIKAFKKDMENNITVVHNKSEINKVLNLLKERINNINSCNSWENFILSDDEESNSKLLSSVFKDNNYINFHPKDIEGPDIILTKSLLPLVSEKNYTDLYYSSKKINSELFLIVFDFQFDMFRLYMLHYYIPIKK